MAGGKEGGVGGACGWGFWGSDDTTRKCSTIPQLIPSQRPGCRRPIPEHRPRSALADLDAVVNAVRLLQGSRRFIREGKRGSFGAQTLPHFSGWRGSTDQRHFDDGTGTPGGNPGRLRWSVACLSILFGIPIENRRGGETRTDLLNSQKLGKKGPVVKITKTPFYLTPGS